MPYRDRHSGPVRSRPEAGLVTEMVRQFADAYAFLRELVQNGIDAGATRIDVFVSYDGAVMSTSVRDDGSGMTQEIIEGPLLTLFASSKEGDGTSIGKYGVGLMSVFALDPDEVLIETWRAEGSFLVRLRRDHSYVLEAAPPRAGSGTRVSVVKHQADSGYAEHVDRCRGALEAWCRHARCPIQLSVASFGGVDASVTRVDAPFELVAPVTVQHVDGGEHLVVGYAAGTELTPRARTSPALREGTGPFAGFYNRGLTLYETQEPPSRLARLRVKALSPALSHTLSRDNVRRDDTFDRLVARVYELARDHLPIELGRRLAESAALAAEGLEAPLLDAQLVAAAHHLGRERVILPLLHPVDGRPTATLDAVAGRAGDHPVVYGSGATALTTALAGSGVFVVRCSDVGLTAEVARQVVWNAAGRRFVAAEEHFSLASPRDPARAGPLVAEIALALSAAGAEVATLALCEVEGAPLGRAALPVPADVHGPTVIAPGDLDKWARRWGAHRRGLWLDVSDPAVARALERAAGDVVLAASILARYVVLETAGEIDERASDGLLEHALAPRGGGLR